MLTLEEIENISFRKAGLGGYKTDDVDAFVDGVILKVKDLEVANKELEARIEQLNKKILKYQEKAESVQDALITAEMTAKKLVKDATTKAETILTEAMTKAEKTISEADEHAEKTLLESNTKAETVLNNVLAKSASSVDANNKIIESQKEQIKRIQNEVSKFRESLIASYKNHLQMISSLPKPEEFQQYQNRLEESYPEAAAKTPDNVGDEVKKLAAEAAAEAEKQLAAKKKTKPEIKVEINTQISKADSETEAAEEEVAENHQKHILKIAEPVEEKEIPVSISSEEESMPEDEIVPEKKMSDFKNGEFLTANNVTSIFKELKAEREKSKNTDKVKEATVVEDDDIFSSSETETAYKTNSHQPIAIRKDDEDDESASEISSAKFGVLKLDEIDSSDE